MTDVLNIEFSDILKIETLPLRIVVRYRLRVEVQTPDVNGDEVESATVKPITFTMFVNDIKDPFAYLPEQKDAPMFYARIREAAKAEYMQKRAVWQ